MRASRVCRGALAPRRSLDTIWHGDWVIMARLPEFSTAESCNRTRPINQVLLLRGACNVPDTRQRRQR